MTDISTSDDMIDVRDVIARFEELESAREDLDNARTDAATDLELAKQGDGDATGELTSALDATTETLAEFDRDDGEEFRLLGALLENLKGYGGDEQWRGDWYPITLIAEAYFTEYCRDLVSDIGGLPRDIPGYLVIDWEATADNLRTDYASVDFGRSSFLYR